MTEHRRQDTALAGQNGCPSSTLSRRPGSFKAVVRTLGSSRSWRARAKGVHATLLALHPADARWLDRRGRAVDNALLAPTIQAQSTS